MSPFHRAKLLHFLSDESFKPGGMQTDKIGFRDYEQMSKDGKVLETNWPELRVNYALLLKLFYFFGRCKMFCLNVSVIHL